MLEPLIVLTVLNCFFMFGSTLTTCALWWQYRSHRCCYSNDSKQTQPKHDLKNVKSNSAPPIFRKIRKQGQDNTVGNSTKSNTAVNHENKSKKNRSQKSATKLKYLSQYKKQDVKNPSSTDVTEDPNFEEKSKMSEASQTANDTKSTVVMEFSTVQKVVQILDNDANLTSGKLSVKSFAPTKDAENKERKLNFDVERTFEPTSPDKSVT